MSKIPFIPFLYKNNSFTFNFEGKTTIVQDSNHNWALLKAAVMRGDWDEVVKLANLKTYIVRVTNGRIRVLDNGTVYLDDKPVHASLTTRLLHMLDEGFQPNGLMRFIENVYENPDPVSQAELYLFMEANNLPLTEDGHFLAYKIVRNDYMDLYTGRISNAIGARPSMPRKEVDSRRDVTCSHGLHACSQDYLPHYGSRNNGDRVVIVKINPRDVVSIPSDYNNAKMRVSDYEVVDELKTWENRVTDFYTSEYSEVAPTRLDSSYETEESEADEHEDNLWDDNLDFEDDDFEDDDFEDDDFEDDEITSEPTAPKVSAPNELVEEAQKYGITVEQLTRIREVRKMGKAGFTRTAIADTVGFSRRQVGRILDGDAWTNIK